MGFVADMFNTSKGAGFTGSSANILNPTTVGQAGTAYNKSQDEFTKYIDFVRSLQAQNGVQNQSNVFNQQQGLADQLQQQAQGAGPNPALAQLANTTGQNVANQAALMAGQRGSNANVGLLARQAAMQGGAAQQQAAGQAAVLRAQQQLAAQQALQQQQGMMGNLATTQVGQEQSGIGNLNQLAQNQQNMLLNSIAQQNNANVGMQSNINNANAGIAQGNQAFQQGVVKNVLGGAGSMLGLAEGGEVKPPPPPPPPSAGMLSAQDSMRKAFKFAEGGPISSFGQMLMQQSQGLANQSSDIGGPAMRDMSANREAGEGVGSFASKAMNFKRSPVGGQIGQMGVSDHPSQVPFGSALAYSGGSIDYTRGGKLPGKAEVKGDSKKNDKVPILGSPGEIMLPRSVTQAKDAPQKAAEFVAAILAKQTRKK